MNSRLKILHLETSRSDALLAEKELRNAGLRFKKMVVTTGASFIEALATFDPDIVISDHSLPSFSAARALQITKGKKLNVPFILLTAQVSEEFAVDILSKGASDYILKDHIKRLPDAIINAIERQHYETMHETDLIHIIKKRELMEEAERLAHFGSWAINLKNLTITCSGEAARILGYGYSEKGISVKKLLLKLNKKDADKVKKEVAKAFASTADSLKLDFRMRAKDGSIKYITTALVIKRNEKMEAVRLVGFCQDITEQKKSEKELKTRTNELRNLAVHLQNVREEERASIAREIHDGLGQQLTCLKMDIAWVSKKIDICEEVVKEKIVNSIELLNKTIDSMRKIATELHPSILDNLPLIDAIQWQSHEFEKSSGIKVEATYLCPYFVFDKNVITGLFRIYQESLTNIAKHAEATRIVTKLEYLSDRILLSISDNGKGFDLLKIQREKITLGILSIRERTVMLGGRYIINSAIGKGTSVLISIPFTPKLFKNHESVNSR